MLPWSLRCYEIYHYKKSSSSSYFDPSENHILLQILSKTFSLSSFEAKSFFKGVCFSTCGTTSVLSSFEAKSFFKGVCFSTCVGTTSVEYSNYFIEGRRGNSRTVFTPSRATKHLKESMIIALSSI